MQIYRICKTFRALPYPGGALNQPRHAINRLLAIDDANDRYREEQLKDPENK